MAIKGKRKGKSRSSRGVATAPRGFLVRPKVPLLRRTSTKVVLVVVLWGVVAAILVGAGAASDAADHRRAVEEFGARVDSILSGSQVAQQLPAGPLILPELAQAIPALRAGEAPEGELVEQAEAWNRRATRAAEGLATIDTEIEALRESRDNMARGLRLYATIADQLALAAALESDDREDLLGATERQLIVAGELVDLGWRQLTEERSRAGLPLAPEQPEIPGLPEGILPEGELPEGIVPEGEVPEDEPEEAPGG